jgi:hypothetical protein
MNRQAYNIVREFPIKIREEILEYSKKGGVLRQVT